MLKALKAQLTALSEHLDEEPPSQQLRRTVNYEALTFNASILKNFVLSLPELLHQTRVWFDDESTPSNLKSLYAYLLTYVYHSVDFLPEEDYGFWGYLDDAYLVGSIYYQTVAYHPKASLRFDDNFSQQIEVWLKTTRMVIPQQVEKLDKLVQNLLKNDFKAFDLAMTTG
jgi:uncharacterized membrane protein YkvA (DUF1232 family)